MRPPKQSSATRGVDPYTAEVRDLSRHLGLVFHRFIEGQAKGRKPVKIKINGVVITSNDPVGHALVRAYDKKPVRVPTATKDYYVDVQAFLLPSEAEVKNYYGTDTDAARDVLDRIGMYGRRNESQGLYVYRNDRLIQWGGWHDMWTTSDEKTKLARVIVDFSDALDDQFSVNISKQKVTLSKQLQESIKTLAEDARKDSRKKFLHDKRRRSRAEVVLESQSSDLPESLADAILTFLIVGAIRELRCKKIDQVLSAHTMLVHVSMRKDDQARISDLVSEQLDLWRAAIDQKQSLDVLIT